MIAHVGRPAGWNERRWRAARRRIRETLAVRRAGAAAGQRDNPPSAGRWDRPAHPAVEPGDH
ncbi:hypothetical protein [Plantactinospora sp. CA-290183]|uniref:hypothetical protein n=1 Tax=Plantactinospora sp. CA-290183 TaxID=3240006 RepID=UPI003D8F11C1